jgi:Holliday junction resolvasome RuvABC endonuclease subunit
MPDLLSIDPSTHACGFALWEEGKLVQAHLLKVKGDDQIDRWRAVGKHCLQFSVKEIAIEYPQVYPQRSNQKGDPNDLIKLGSCVGAIAMALSHVKVSLYLPHEWKGNLPKEIVTLRVKKRLTTAEYENISMPAKSLAHNVFEAVGIGLHHQKRPLW